VTTWITERANALDRPVASVRAALAHPVAGPILKIVLGYVLLIEVLVQALFGQIDIPFVDVGFLELGRKAASIPRGVFVQGAVVGSLYALVGMGLILVYRANRIINFAQAQLGAIPAVAALFLVSFKGMPYIFSVPLMLIGAVALGAVVETMFIRRFAQAPRLILTVVTIGVGFLLLVLEFFTKLWIAGEDKLLSNDFPTPFNNVRFSVGQVFLTGDHLLAIAVVGAIVIGLGAFFRFTDMGIAVRASAENGERASLLGIPVRRVSTVVWVIAAVMSAVGVFLRAPLVGLPVTGFVGPSLLLYGLAVAVIARMEKLPTAFFAGMLIGAIDRAAIFSTNRASLANAIMLVVILVALLVQRSGLSRAQEAGASTWQAVKDFRPVPTELRGVPEVNAMRFGLGGLILALVLTGPFIVRDANTGLLTVGVIYAMVGVSLVILAGWAGQISLGQFAISGIGAAVAGGLAANHNWDFFATLIVAGVAGAFVAVLIGLPALRIQGLFLAVTTLAFAFTVQSFVLTREFFGWLLPKDFSAVARPVLYGRFSMTQDSEVLWFTLRADAKFYYLCLVFLVLFLAVARSLRKNRSGRIFIGARDNGRLMQAFGVNLARTRLAAFAISGFIAAVAGALYAYQQGVVEPGAFPPEKSIELFAMTVIGGLTSLPGAMLGAAFVKGLPLLPGLKNVEQIELLTSGVGLVLVLYFLPGGLAEGVYRIRDRFLRFVAVRHNIHVPSLVADSLVQDSEEADDSLMAAEEHLLETARLEQSDDVITCPACGAFVPLVDARHHEHFAPLVTTEDGELVAIPPSDEPAPAGNGRRKLKRGVQ
jgi:branched-chain amino acid transport system permease protein